MHSHYVLVLLLISTLSLGRPHPAFAEEGAGEGGGKVVIVTQQGSQGQNNGGSQRGGQENGGKAKGSSNAPTLGDFPMMKSSSVVGAPPPADENAAALPAQSLGGVSEGESPTQSTSVPAFSDLNIDHNENRRIVSSFAQQETTSPAGDTLGSGAPSEAGGDGGSGAAAQAQSGSNSEGQGGSQPVGSGASPDAAVEGHHH